MSTGHDCHEELPGREWSWRSLGHLLRGVPIRSAEDSFELLEQMRIFPLLYASGDQIEFPELTEALAAHEAIGDAHASADYRRRAAVVLRLSMVIVEPARLR